MMDIKPIKMVQSILLFSIPGIVFYLLLKVLMPFLIATVEASPFLLWTLVGTFLLFGPLFLLSLILLKADGYPLNWKTISSRFRLRRMTGQDWLWILGGFGVSTLLTGLLIGVWALSPLPFDVNELRGISPISVGRLEEADRWIYLPMAMLLFFNYFGEEFLWRGYILPRQEAALGKWAWLANAGLHMVFHLVFDLKMMILFLPFLLLMPYVVYKTKNTYNSIIIHALLGAPTMILVTLGVLSA